MFHNGIEQKTLSIIHYPGLVHRFQSCNVMEVATSHFCHIATYVQVKWIIVKKQCWAGHGSQRHCQRHYLQTQERVSRELYILRVLSDWLALNLMYDVLSIKSSR